MIFCRGRVGCVSGGDGGMKKDREARKDGDERDQLLSGMVDSER